MNSADPLPASTDPPPVDGRASRWNNHRVERRRALIRAARKAVDALGPSASMEEIATAAGTSKSVFYRYFGDKTGLQHAMAELVIAQMKRKIVDAAKMATTPRDGLRAMISTYLQIAAASPNVYSFVTRVQGADLTPSLDPESPDAVTDFLAALTDLLASPMRAHLGGALHQGHTSTGLDYRYWPRSAIGMVRAAGEQWLSTPPGRDKPAEDQLTDALTAWLFDGIHNSAPSTSRGPQTPEKETS